MTQTEERIYEAGWEKPIRVPRPGRPRGMVDFTRMGLGQRSWRGLEVGRCPLDGFLAEVTPYVTGGATYTHREEYDKNGVTGGIWACEVQQEVTFDA